MRQIMDTGEIEQEKQHVSYVELPNASKKPGSSYQESSLHHHPSENQRCCVAGYEHEQIGSIAEAVIACCKPGECGVGNVAQENGPVRQARKRSSL